MCTVCMTYPNISFCMVCKFDVVEMKSSIVEKQQKTPKKTDLTSLKNDTEIIKGC